MSEQQDGVIVIPEKAGLAEAEELHRTLLDMPREAPLRFDASKADNLSTAFVLTIVSAIATRSDSTPPATVIDPSTAFVDAFTDLGLFQDLMKMEFAS